MSLPNVYIDVVFVYKNQMYRPTQPKRFTNDAGQGVYYRSVIVTLSNGREARG